MRKYPLLVAGVLLVLMLLLAACQQGHEAPGETTAAPAVTTAEPGTEALDTEEQTTAPETTPEETTEAVTEQPELVINTESTTINK